MKLGFISCTGAGFNARLLVHPPCLHQCRKEGYTCNRSPHNAKSKDGTVPVKVLASIFTIVLRSSFVFWCTDQGSAASAWRHNNIQETAILHKDPRQ